MRAAVFMLLSFGLVHQAAAQPPLITPPEPNRFASRIVASRTVARNALPALARDPDPVNRQCAMLQLAEGNPPTSEELDLLIRGLADSDERVRFQAAAGLMRLGDTATSALIRALIDETPLGTYQYASEALNGRRELSLRVSDMAFASLLHSRALDTTVLLQAYAARPPEPSPESQPPPPPRGERRQLNRKSSSYAARLLMLLKNGRLTPSSSFADALMSSDEALAAAVASRAAEVGPEATRTIAALSAAVDRHSSDRVRDAASLALASMGPRGHEALHQLLATTQARTRRAALAVLPIEAADAATRIADGLRDVDASVRIVALRRIEVPITSSSSGRDYRQALCPGGEYDTEPSDRQTAARTTAQHFLASLPSTTDERLRALLADDRADVREAAVRALATYACVLRDQHGGVGEPIARAMQDAAANVRAAAASALSDLALRGIQAPASTLTMLLDFYRSDTTDERGEILGAIAALDTPTDQRAQVVRTVITECLAARFSSCDRVTMVLNKRPDFADLAMADLATRLRRPSDADDELFGVLKDLDADRPAYRRALEDISTARQDEMQVDAAMLLARHRWSSPAAINVLVNAVSTGNSDAAKTLVSLGGAAVDRVLAVIDNPATSNHTKEQLTLYGLADAVETDPRVATWMLAAASTRGSPMQASAVARVSRIHGRLEEVRTALHAALSSPDASVRHQAVSIWQEMEWPPDSVVARAFKDSDPNVREAAMPLLALFPATDSARIAAARGALEDPVAHVRTAAIEAVAQMGVEGGDLLAAYLDRHEVTADFLRAISPSRFRLATAAERRARPLSPRLVATLQQKAADAGVELRLAIDLVLSAGGVVGVNRTPLRDRLESSDPNDRAGAARALAAMNDDVWAQDGRLLAVMMDTRVMEIVKDRLGAALDDLYPPGFTYMSGSMQSLPSFPWPPPAGYSGVAVPRTLLSLGPQPTCGDVYNTLNRALSLASTGFTQGLFNAPGGFAVVARMERVGADGTPLPGQARWMKEGSPTLSFLEFLGDLFFERPGYFRVVAFVLTNDANPGNDPNARLPEPEEGALAMPPELAQAPLTDQQLLALVYSFERRGSAQIQPWKDGAPSPREHLERAGIWAALSAR